MRPPFHEQIVLPKTRTVLLLVDIQEEQRTDPEYRAVAFDRVLSNASELLAAARSSGCKVVHTAYIRDFSIEPPRPFEATRSDGSPTFSDAAAGQTAICGEVAPTSDEAVITKNDASAFLGTDLNQLLTDGKTEWLIICGVWTEACISATVRDAILYGFRVLLVKDACGSGSKAMHETAVLNLANRLYGGGICDTERAITLLSGGKADVWRTVDPVPLRFRQDNITQLYDEL